MKTPLQLRWRRGRDMPFGMGDYIQSVMVQGTLYVGGGVVGRGGNDKIEMAYDTSSGTWAMLPPYRASYFGMAVINTQLVLVGGIERGNKSKVGVWSAERREWTHPYPDMATTRSACSAVGYNEWLVVAGGWGDGTRILSSVEILNTDSKQWYAGPPTPTGWIRMKTAVVGCVWYFMGGCTGKPGSFSATYTAMVFSVSLPALTSQLHSQQSRATSHNSQLWKEIPGLQMILSAPLSMSGCLLAVGGNDEVGDAVSAIHLYQPATGEWVKVGDLPRPRSDCMCVMIGDREILVAGGPSLSTVVDIALIQ